MAQKHTDVIGILRRNISQMWNTNKKHSGGNTI
jgi:hypothetical protein